MSKKERLVFGASISVFGLGLWLLLFGKVRLTGNLFIDGGLFGVVWLFLAAALQIRISNPVLFKDICNLLMFWCFGRPFKK